MGLRVFQVLGGGKAWMSLLCLNCFEWVFGVRSEVGDFDGCEQRGETGGGGSAFVLAGDTRKLLISRIYLCRYSTQWICWYREGGFRYF